MARPGRSTPRALAALSLALLTSGGCVPGSGDDICRVTVQRRFAATRTEGASPPIHACVDVDMSIYRPPPTERPPNVMRAEAVALRTREWEAGSVLHVGFMEGDEAVISRVLEVTKTWSDLANIK